MMPDLAAFLVAVGPLAILITKTVDTIRNALDKAGTWPKVVWNLAAFALGVAYCLAFGVNLAGLIDFRGEVSSMLQGTGGEVLTGLAIGATASFWHEHMDATSSKATANRAAVPVSASE
jgi:hypothetical protein